MKTPLEHKASLDEIKARFDKDVARFSDLASGQVSTVDAALTMELVTKAAVACTARIENVLDIGCGAGNNSLKLAQYASPFDCTLVDLSRPMLAKATERLSATNSGKILTYQGDFRTIDLPDGVFDVILAAAVLHHLRDDHDWKTAFEKIFRLTAPGGSFWITDLVSQETDAVREMMWSRYGHYLSSIGGEKYRLEVLDCIDREDSPRSVTYQLDLLREVGYDRVELLHKNACFAAFGAIKAG